MPLALATGHLVDWTTRALEANVYVAHAGPEIGAEELTKAGAVRAASGPICK